MSKFKITKFEVTESVNSGPTINMGIDVLGGISYTECANLRKVIEDENRDWHQTYYIIGGRGNGKVNYFSDWCRVSASVDIRFEIKRVILHNPATIVFWDDGTKTVVKCQDGDTYSPEVGIAMCYMKKALGNKSNFNNTFKKHIPETDDVLTKPLNQLSGRYKWNANNGEKKSTKKYARLNSEAVYRILRENKSSVAELARSVGVDKSAVYTWLRGGGVKRRNISKLVKVLHVPEEVIIKEEK